MPGQPHPGERPARAAPPGSREERYDFLARATQEPIWDWDLVTGELTWSSAGGRIFGIHAGEVEPTLAWWEGRVHPEDRARVLASLDAALEEDAGSWTEEYRFRSADGAYVTVLDRGFVVRHEGRPVRMIGAMVDVGARSAAASAPRCEGAGERPDRGQQVEALRGLVAGTAHDLNNQLTTILGHVELLLLDHPEGEPPHPDLREIREAARQAAALTRELLRRARQPQE
jgi:PAS domain S-box-containing protein